MSDFLIRDLDPRVMDSLKLRAEASGRSLQGEMKAILELAAHASDVDVARELADRITADLVGRPHADSAVLIREVRDR